jgi:hypothetical protein
MMRMISIHIPYIFHAGRFPVGVDMAAGKRSGTLTLIRLAWIAPFVLAAAPALAGTFSPPDGCTAYVTVQHASCQVSHHYTCEGDAKGDQWAVYAGADGPYYMSRIDAETRWVESFDLIAGEADQLATEADPASFTALLDTGRDDYDFSTESNSGEVRRYAGYDQLTGRSVTIDGVTLERTEFELKSYASDGSFLHQRKGQQLISRDWRIFFADVEDFENAAGDRQHTTDTPMTFTFPGEAGFLTDRPQFGCDQMMTGDWSRNLRPARFDPEGAP